MIQEILHYLIEHPDAKDKIEGIIQWWLPTGVMERPIDNEARDAVEALVVQGLLLQHDSAPSGPVYGMNKQRLNEIKAVVNESRGKAQDEQG